MTAVSEPRAERRTNSRLAESDFRPETRRLRKADWWYIHSLPNNGDFTTSSEEDAGQSRGTEFVTSRRTVRPVRKDSIGVKLGGERKVLLQQWECVVLRRERDVVCCELHDLTDESNPGEYAEIYVQQFNAYDIPLLVEGSVFYWSLGYLQRVKGQVVNFSEFIIRRMPKLSRSQTGEIAVKVAKLRGLLDGP